MRKKLARVRKFQFHSHQTIKAFSAFIQYRCIYILFHFILYYDQSNKMKAFFLIFIESSTNQRQSN